ncbi:MAG: tetratricopeptide repeat protein [Planctomycetota bacterium]
MNRISKHLIPAVFIAGAVALPLSLAGCGSSGSGGGSIGSGGTVADARELTARADRAFLDNDFRQAEALYRQSLSIFREQPGALNNLGNALVAMERYLDAEEVYKQAIEVDPSRPEVHGNRGRLWLEAGYPREAILYFNEALELDPRWMPAIRGKAKASHLLSIADERYLRMLREAMILESNASWRAFFDSERSRVQDALRAESEISASSS